MKQEAKRPLLLQFIVWMMMTVAVLWSAGAVMAVWHAVEAFDREAVEARKRHRLVAGDGLPTVCVVLDDGGNGSRVVARQKLGALVVLDLLYAVCRCQYGKIFGLPVVGRAVLAGCRHLWRGLLQPVFPAA